MHAGLRLASPMMRAVPAATPRLCAGHAATAAGGWHRMQLRRILAGLIP